MHFIFLHLALSGEKKFFVSLKLETNLSLETAMSERINVNMTIWDIHFDAEAMRCTFDNYCSLM